MRGKDLKRSNADKSPSLRLPPVSVWIGVGAAVFYWLVDALFLETHFGSDDDIVSRLFPLSDPEELFERALVVGTIVVCSALVHMLVAKGRQAERELQAGQERFHSLVKDSSDIIAILESDGTIRYISPASLRVLGYRPEELMGTNAFSYAHLEDAERARRRFVDQVTASAKAQPPIEYRVPRADGSVCYLEMVATNLLDDPSVRGIVVNCRDTTERKRAMLEIQRLNETLEKRIAERTARLSERERQLEDLVGKLLRAQEEERRRVAYEIHDGLAQVAIGAQQLLEAFVDEYFPGSAAKPEGLERPLELVRQTVEEARRVIEGLRPAALEDLGLAAAIRTQVERLRDEGWAISYEEALEGERLPHDMEVALYRVAQEALTNVRKHSRALRAHVALGCGGGKVRLEVRDEGRGFDPSGVLRSGGSGERVGLSSMRERVTLLGGELRVTSEPGAGTSVVAKVPLRVLQRIEATPPEG
ncbi:MAG: PAS domain-containing sensor histidine kinase [Actinomycetota bacterium]|nr:PAS domain-containing sensor histidine kinase [Actinomycetota bacterium]